MRHTVDEMIAEGNTVAAQWTVEATHRDNLALLQQLGAVPKSGQAA